MEPLEHTEQMKCLERLTQSKEPQESSALGEQMQKTVLLGVTGCIAAYKSCEIVRLLQKAGVRVKVVMTHHAARFVGPATFKALTREEVALELFDEPSAPVHHVSLAKEADLFLIAPATANTIAKIAHGVADDLLSTTALAAHDKLLIAPAMNVAMWNAPATQENIALLRSRGVGIIDPVSGYLACGDEGAGKLAAVEEITACVLGSLQSCSDLAGTRVLVTAGPTYEPLDPVRFLGNRSSGLTGFAIAAAAQLRGAQVTLVTGPTALPDPFGVEVIHVQTAREMLEASRTPFAASNIAVFSAAVADFAPSAVAAEKIKKTSSASTLTLELVQNPDIIATLAAEKRDTYVVGFAAETGDPLPAARDKLVRKHADLIVANDVSSPGLGFGTPENKVWLVTAQGVDNLPQMSKRAIANAILDKALSRMRV